MKIEINVKKKDKEKRNNVKIIRFKAEKFK